MTTKVIHTKYIDNGRVDTVEYTYTLADDYIRLGQLYTALGRAKDSEEIAKLQQFINLQVQIIKGYGDANAPTSSAE